ncbi:MAG: T9SS type A sorting domain-containing protein [Chitinophagales bacterium]
MKKIFTLFLLSTVVFISRQAFADWQDHPYNVTFNKNNKEQTNHAKQQQLRIASPWKQFSEKNPGWKVMFDERSAMPHRSYGTGIQITASGDAAAKAMSFLQKELAAFNIPVSGLTLRSAHNSKKYQYVDYYQNYLGLEVLSSRVTVRMTMDNRVVLFGADVFNDISISTNPQLVTEVIPGYAVNGIAYEITGITVDPLLKILPVPAGDEYEYHLVYHVTVNANDRDGYPARYYTLVDANNGDVLYRSDEINHINDLLTAQAEVSDPNPWEPEVVRPLRNLRVKIDGIDYYTQSSDGVLSLAGITLPASATIYLQGLWCKVVTGNNGTIPPSFTQTLNAGNNTVDFTSHSSISERSAYYHVNVIHDFMKTLLPDYTEMDVALLTNVDRTDGTCNAYYDGSSINFYLQGGGCFDLATCGDVVYHEYGHGIDGRYYSLYSNGLDNGAVGEGYSDIWGISITDNPILGIGLSDVDPTAYVRRYDINKKVYPQDIQGEVHADGEIIGGAWYDTRVNLGNMDTMMAIFVEALGGLADGFNGSEGVVFRDILLDALAADDNDGDLNNGTPHDIQILSAFALHGISLIGDITLVPAEILQAPAAVPVSIEADITTDFPIYFGNAMVHYKKNTESTYDSAQMNLISGITYGADLPSQIPGTILDYYFTATDIYGITVFTKPGRVLDADPNLPYKMLISYSITLQEDFDIYEGPWVLGDPADDATTGQWEVDSPNPSYIAPGVAASLVQTSLDHTPNNNTNLCAFTGQAQPNDGAGTNDCDRGRNTLYSPKYDLTTYANPAISYYRWYSNDQGANPGNDPWRVYITNGDGIWKTIENSHTPDHGWRAMAFRVLDYVSATTQVQLKFIASDSLMTNIDLDGQSLVEAAVDDLYLWNEVENVGINSIALNGIRVSPNPAVADFTISFAGPFLQDATIELADAMGRTVYFKPFSRGSNSLIVPVADLAPGFYTLKVIEDENVYTEKIAVQH